MINEIRVFSPATVSNVACGFDVLGFALESIGDEMIVRKTTQKGLTINNVNNKCEKRGLIIDIWGLLLIGCAGLL